MKCMICGKDNLQLEYKRGKGKADIKNNYSKNQSALPIVLVRQMLQ